MPVLFQSNFGPPGGHSLSSPVSLLRPSRFGPRHCGQSSAEAAARPRTRTASVPVKNRVRMVCCKFRLSLTDSTGRRNGKASHSRLDPFIVAPSIMIMNRTAIVRRLLTWFEGHARDLPWRKTRNPYAIWISEIMLQQTQVKTVIPFWERWLRELPTVESLAGASSEKIHRLWEGLGYYTRVRNLQKAA